MATATGASIFARARTIATQTAGDAHSSAVIDAAGGIRSLLNHSIRALYRQKAKDVKFLRDIVTRTTVDMTAGIGACPDTIMREFLGKSQIQDDDGSLIAYFEYNIDQSSGATYTQLGYVVMLGNNFLYTPPAPGTSTSYSGNLYVTVPCFPTFPASMADNITFPAASVIDDLVILLVAAITGTAKFETV